MSKTNMDEAIDFLRHVVANPDEPARLHKLHMALLVALVEIRERLDRLEAPPPDDGPDPDSFTFGPMVPAGLMPRPSREGEPVDTDPYEKGVPIPKGAKSVADIPAVWPTVTKTREEIERVYGP